MNRFLSRIPLAAGAALHVLATLVYNAQPASLFNVGALCWSLAPYLLLLLVSRKFQEMFSIVAGALVMLLVDASALWSVYIRPASSTAGLNLLVAPLFHLGVTLPVVIVAALAERRLRRR